MRISVGAGLLGAAALTALALGARLPQVGPGAAVGAQSPPAKPATGSEEKPKRAKEPRVWDISSDELSQSDASGKGDALHVVATADTGTVVRADKMSWDERAKHATASGNLKIEDEQADAVGDLVEIEYAKKKQTLVLTGSVKVVLKPKKEKEGAVGSIPVAQAPGASAAAPAPAAVPGKAPGDPARPAGPDDAKGGTGESRRHPIDVTCEKLSYQYGKEQRHGVLTGNVVAVQKLSDCTRTITAPAAEWFGLEDRVLLRGPVRFSDTKGREGKTDKDVEISTKEGAETLKMKSAVYRLPVDEDDEKEPDAAGVQKPADGKSSPPATGTPGSGPGRPPVTSPGAPPAGPGKQR